MDRHNALTEKSILTAAICFLLYLVTQVSGHGIGFGIRNEIIFLNLEDGYFGCQVNESTDFLQLYELSRLCDGVPDCYRASDELRKELKCSNDCGRDNGLGCQNGVCLDSQCHCNDGYGGCNCELTDENECKNRPCDVFAHCSNTMGGFHCSCYPGYVGDGFHCQDIDECLDPSIASRCVQNAECCNLPAHWLCKCKPGFQGDGEKLCLDIDECLNPHACGLNAKCTNLIGNYTCECLPGYGGNPYLGCGDVNECQYPGSCAPGALCSNGNGVHTCYCPPGSTGDPYHGGCLDIDECQNAPCGYNALCTNVPGSFKCSCPPGQFGDPFRECTVHGCLEHGECPPNLACIHHSCQDPCLVPGACGPDDQCKVQNHHPICLQAQLRDHVCQYNEDCPPNKLCDRLNRVCVNPCQEDSCGDYAECFPANHGIECRCLAGYSGNPYILCSIDSGCKRDSDCPLEQACLNGVCGNPCVCGTNAVCDVINHRPVCKCLPGYNGNPAVGCTGPANPCVPNPCGLHALCELDAGGPICYCRKGMTGNPFKLCIPEGNECQPNPCGPNSGCRVVGGRPQCFCQPNFEGDPPQVPCSPPRQPCNPSPCGPNTQCTVLQNGFAKCTCLPGHLESPNTIRGCVKQRNPCEPNPCGYGALCDPSLSTPCYCPEHLAGNPYKSCTEPVNSLCLPGPCGPNADCYIVGNKEQCYCKYGTFGDPYTGCGPLSDDPCFPNPCGPGAVCQPTAISQVVCLCPDGSSAGPGQPCLAAGQCTKDSDCPRDKACLGYHCRDPCPGACGINAHCRVEQHHPVCSCPPELGGNPIIRCYQLIGYNEERNPCVPSPCGTNTHCSVNYGKPVCSCLPNYFGDPQTGCRAECSINSDCGRNQACVRQRCVDPCAQKNICGLGAVCTCRDHTVSCTCPSGFMGDPFIQCIRKPVAPVTGDSTQMCGRPSPCGPQTSCVPLYGQVATCDPCQAQPGRPGCRPECLSDFDCRFDQACIGNKCTDPCVGSCGVNAQCVVLQHSPVCYCPAGLTGNPFEHCSTPVTAVADVDNSCERVYCGSNAVCRTSYGHNECVCQPGFFGDPYVGCRPQCVINSDCPAQQACLNYQCVDPCLRACGLNAKCSCVNHVPVCYCPRHHTGDPFVSCYPIQQDTGIVPADSSNPCNPSPCGPNSRCLISHQSYAVCSCLPGYRGVPPMCQPECIVSTQCSPDKACINQKCSDPCVGTCGLNTRCQVVQHNPICSCEVGHIGDPFTSCRPPPLEDRIPGNPCAPSPCGANSECVVRGGRPVCSCSRGYIGSPPFCRPECTMSQECRPELACLDEKCRDPCPGNCGQNAQCHVVNHTPLCSCLPGYQGDAFFGCFKIPPTVVAEQPRDPCETRPCGQNTQCSNVNGVANCRCIPPYTGDPYGSGCRPECLSNAECAPSLACLATHCRNPCPGVCGLNAVCNVVNHIAVCTCVPGYIGDPFQACRPEPIKPVVQVNPCDPSPCGPNSLCRERDKAAVCRCAQGYLGAPPNCRPECVSSSECTPQKACINQRCKDPCRNICGKSARCDVINHNPVCTCPRNMIGDPFVECVKEPAVIAPPENPCVPSPCGGYTECRPVDGRPACSCLSGMLGAPPNCRPQCLIHADCPTHLACISQRCRDPCVSACGVNTQCAVVNHQPVCTCQSGYQGDPYSLCSPKPTIIEDEVRDPCNPSPCGPNALCKERNGAGSCVCLPEYTGDPYTGCRPECVLNTDCPYDKVCSSNKCRNPCTGLCGINAECKVSNHVPTCYCLYGYTGNALQSCHPIPKPEPERPSNPCVPSPCGPYSVCRPVNGHAVCSCQATYIGSPPRCKPQCIVSAECPLDRACLNQKCVDPCPGTCASNAICNVVNHNPICSCRTGYTGDPFIRCLKEEKRPVLEEPTGNPCVPSPCGPNAQCRPSGSNPSCSCLAGYIGRPPNCRPECTINAECPGNLACLNERCRDPCPGSCGPQASCVVIKHAPQCSCLPGYTGDPFAGCSPELRVPPTEGPRLPCEPSPCGANAICKERNGAGSCVCLPEYFGDPYTGCRPECIVNSDCDRSKACVNKKCQNPCPGACGLNAECRVINHAPSCSCVTGYTGDPLTSCRPIPIEPVVMTDPCQPSPCGPYSVCKVINGHAVCSCQPNYIGAPPACRPECTVSTDCPQDKSCINKKCGDPCPGTCGLNAKCNVVNHNPICSCMAGFTGDPLVRCIKRERPVQDEKPSGNPCIPSPCGPYSKCQEVNRNPACSCLPDYVGRPPNCRPECTTNTDCPGNLACQNERCKDPCPGSCGVQASCTVVAHSPHCSCMAGYTGDPFSGCSPIVQIRPTEGPRNPCNPSPCGANAVCKERNGAGSCVCLPEYFGDPYTGCRPECVVNTDCDRSRACVNNKCKNPCPGSCGLNAECRVVNHAPSCTCLPGYTGNPLTSCALVQATEIPEPVNPCESNICGPNSICRTQNGHAVCSCLPNYIGTPPACRPECVVSSDCPQDRACINQKCADPCPGTCATSARCHVVNHNPICSCQTGYTGDPFVLCKIVEVSTTVAPPRDPCTPSPCGPSSQCRAVGQTPACSCLPDTIGRPPNCRPECVRHSDCPGNQACVNSKCRDPCLGACGISAVCRVVNHGAVCTCPQGTFGDASTFCQPVPQTTSTERAPYEPCFPSPCGANADCRELNGDALCTCLPGFEGDPYSGCRRECESNDDCPTLLACTGFKCVDPCPGTCGVGAQCSVNNHIPVCTCPAGFTGDPFFSCSPAPVTPAAPPGDPCIPSPCGPNSICRATNGHAVCSCSPNFIGNPPTCRPECVSSSECSPETACINQRCKDPCPNICGLRAQCRVRNHNPICSCPEGYTGDPFSSCHLIPASPVELTPEKPTCDLSICGPYSECRPSTKGVSCSCLPNHIGTPPNCRPECILSTDCSSSLTCINQRCTDPCIGSCGANTRCHVVNHIPVCDCDTGFTGDPFTLCTPIVIPPSPPPAPTDPCSLVTCGPNARCLNGACQCLPEFTGNPYESCRPECILSTECPADKACIRNKCQDPCPGTCGQDANCQVVNHIPTCVCPQGFSGDPFTLCRPVPQMDLTPVNPCEPSPCGPNSQCRSPQNVAVCSCLSGYIGQPPTCRPECVVSTECHLTQACVNQKCTDPCLGSCGLEARCQVINHSPICSCPPGRTGDPFSRCLPIPAPPPVQDETPRDPCVPSPCGPNSICRVSGDLPSCSCLSGYIGTPPTCRPECVINPDCPKNLACINNRCKDPCPGSCGINAQCNVISHSVSCTCPAGMTGNPFVSCSVQIADVPSNPCQPSPCGTNAECRQRDGAGSCSCIEGYQGNPYEGCRPECVLSADCPTNLACIRNRCMDPCPGTCGVNAVCSVINHVPTCYCQQDFEGDPFQGCRPRPLQIEPEPEVRDPCRPSPCGQNAECRAVNGHAVCTCLPTFIGQPPTCRPECVVNPECPQNQACSQQKCIDPCPGTCGFNARCQVINHSPICSCPPGQTGDPFARCTPIVVQEEPKEPPRNPCAPSPCGPFSQCRVSSGGQASCSCLTGYTGSPPNCRPECLVNTDCSLQQACIAEKCRDPCPGSCGVNTDCRVQNHIPTCVCMAGFTGDPFTYCNQIIIEQTPVEPQDPCIPSPCGANARCNNGLCTCFDDYRGDPYVGCRPECTLNTECPRDRACVRNHCVDPCPGTCGLNAVCQVINHIPTCSCPEPLTGDPFTSCRQQAPVEKPEPCSPSPCGPNSVCRVQNGLAVCSCLPGMISSPPVCRPECQTSSECTLQEACIRQKCTDPCPGTCGSNARCQVINHDPICSCPPGYSGDPFVFCQPIPERPPVQDETPRDPCIPSPCGPNAVCRVSGNVPSCSCLSGYIGAPPSCRPECVINPDCPKHLACINNRCRDPCPGSCGVNAQCNVISHSVSCTCPAGMTGNPFVSCSVQQIEIPSNPCQPSPCGVNAECRQRDGAGSCSCIEGYQGNPYEGCRPECVLSADCPTKLACLRNKCVDPCPGTCGANAVCSVSNHVPMCFCLPEFEGNPFQGCRLRPQQVEPVPEVRDPCRPSPCGQNAECRAVNGHAVCTCLPTFIGQPPACRPECVVNPECPQNLACSQQKCSDPCPGTCGFNARCQVINHNPVCSCPPGQTGDPFTRCIPFVQEEPKEPPRNPCVPSPCGPFSECRLSSAGQASCSCLTSYIGSPPNCRPECLVNTDCNPQQACIAEKCRDPCPGSCGINTDCRVQNHIPTCVCRAGFTGDPFTYCNQIIIEQTPVEPKDPCIPSPCGANARCNNGLCTCFDDYRGDPYIGCRPECTLNTDCPRDKACVRNHCIDPCPGTCGLNAVCQVINHIPTCSCPEPLTGDPFTSCREQQRPIEPPSEPCTPSPCGPNAVCRVQNGLAVCSCLPGMISSPPSCRPECLISAECTLREACIRQKCSDPCPGTCGVNARCQVINHDPICSCSAGFTGDPFVQCQPIPEKPNDVVVERPVNPCVPSPCGPNAECQRRQDNAACSCLPGFIGSPPSCRPECTINPECPASQACINNKCRDPCPGSCGTNAVCQVISHIPSCTCLAGHTGDPFSHCQPVADEEPRPAIPRDPCMPSPCGANAQCSVQGSVGVCRCLPEYQGNPYEGCRPECVVSPECTSNLACIRNKCRDPCPGTCGINALCSVSNHIPICSCPAGMTGNPFTSCSPVPRPEIPQEPCVPSPCGPNTQCRSVNGIAVCECLPGLSGVASSPSGCRPECTISANCPKDKACINSKCADPCIGVCGYLAACHTINHSPVCSCLPGHVGDPFTECRQQEEPRPVDPCNPSPCSLNGQCRNVNGIATCIYPECVINQDCPRDKACFSQTCRDPCIDACGINALCQPVNHLPVCSCAPGFTGQPRLSCYPIPQVPELPRPECTTDSECPSDRACYNGLCVDPCSSGASRSCAANAECHVHMHRPICSCGSGMAGIGYYHCYEIGCRSDSECTPREACVNRECVDPCKYTWCGKGAACISEGSRARCVCPLGTQGDPHSVCTRPECTSHDHCPNHLACVSNKCIDPCSCAAGALCTVRDHIPSCRCQPGYIGNPHVSCTPAPVAEMPVCQVDGDCASKLACLNNECKNPCFEIRPCGSNAECIVVDTLPLRTMSCQCLPGFIGDADVECIRAPVPEPGCSNDDECAIHETCINRQCVNPCTLPDTCASNADCIPLEHRAVCSCPEGHTGDPFTNCVKVTADFFPECTTDDDCSSKEACTNNRCRDPCLANPCGYDAYCSVSLHRAICSCQQGWAGEPNLRCYRPECTVDSDCRYDKACISGSCVSACLQAQCGRGAECRGEGHSPFCLCPPGTQGDPHVACVSVQCHYNEDCADHEACDRLNRVCLPACQEDTCARDAMCTARNHQPVCTCKTNLRGNPYFECVPVIAEECEKDGDCPGTLACINRKCVDPCTLPDVCSPEQRCSVSPTLPLRTIVCTCPEDTITTSGDRCVPIISIEPECRVDSDCSDAQVCSNAHCRDACLVDPCGHNALCISREHIAICSCPHGYYGNPYVECTLNTSKTDLGRTDFPRPDMVVSCQSDGVQVEIHIEEKGFNGVLYVKGHSKEEDCRRILAVPNDSYPRIEIFKVHFGRCGLIHVNGQANFVLVIQKHPMLVTFKTQAYHIKCVYTTGEQNVTLGFNVSMLTTAGTIANTGPPPTCVMHIVTQTGQEVNSAEIGDNLMLQVEVQPSSIYGGFARSCVAKSMEDSVENEYIVTDENGCATDPSIFGDWDYNPDTRSLLASFSAFKFPSSDNIRFQCNIRVCFGRCQPVNCRGYNAFGKRRRRDVFNATEADLNATEIELIQSVGEGQLREELTIQSNAIITFERKEERFSDPIEAPSVEKVEDICVSTAGFIIAIVVTALLALVAVAVAVSCWLIAYHRAPLAVNPLPHPLDFPNPLFAPKSISHENLS